MTIRVREYAGLPEFSAENVTVGNARVDKIEIVFPRHRIQYNDIDDFQNYLRDIAALPDSLFSVYNPPANTPRRVASETFQFRAGKLLYGERITFYPVYNTDTRKFTVKLDLNFSRFAASNTPDILRALPVVNWPAYQRRGTSRVILPALISRRMGVTIFDLLEKDTTKLGALKRRALDNNDNWMLGTTWQAVHDIRNLTECYIAMCQDYIENQFSFPLGDEEEQDTDGLPDTEAEQDSVTPHFDWSRAIINHLEVYFDFQHDNALDFMRFITPRIIEIAPIYGESTYRTVRRGRTYDSNSITVELSRGIELAVYPKTLNRTRWEIRFKSSLRTVLSEEVAEHQHPVLDDLRGVGTAENSYGELIGIAIEYATQAAHNFISQLRLDEPSPLSTATITKFMYEVSRACDNKVFTMNMLIASLINTPRSVTTTEHTEKTLKILCTRKVLKRIKTNVRDNAVRYRVTNAYMRVVEALRTEQR